MGTILVLIEPKANPTGLRAGGGGVFTALHEPGQTQALC
jgi:hypothetical protein